MENIDSKIKKQLEELWGKVGLIVNLSQMLEYTLANILAFDEILKKFDNKNSMSVLEYNTFASRAEALYNELIKRPFGYGLREAERLKFFTDDSQKRLKRICEERNFVIHRVFRDDLKLNHLETDPEFYFERLELLIEDMYYANEELNNIFLQQKEQYKLIW